MGTEINSVSEFEEILCLDSSLSIRNSEEMAPVELADTIIERP
jgi:hypothetical protein